jgi:large subunit ribosomal protein L9
MKIILKENIENLGKRGDIINVAAGYGRNYLIPRKLAIEVTPSNMKLVEMEQKALRKKLEREFESYQSVIDQLNQASLSFERKAGEKDVIFGSVSTADIKEALDKLGMEVDKKKILLDEPIKRLGNYTVPIKVFHDERAEIRIEVKKEGAEDEKKKPAVREETATEEKEGLKAKEKKEESPGEPEQKKPEELAVDKVKKDEKTQEIPEEKETPEEIKDQTETTQETPEEKKEEPEDEQEDVPEKKPEESSEDITEEERKDQ